MVVTLTQVMSDNEACVYHLMNDTVVLLKRVNFNTGCATLFLAMKFLSTLPVCAELCLH